jgi:hypothetical protein
LGGPINAWSYKPRRHLHFDPRPEPATVEAYVRQPEAVARHAFWPMIRFEAVTTRYRPVREGDEPSRRERVREKKQRTLLKSAHLDGAILSYYAAQLSARYESLLQVSGLHEQVLAYRPGVGMAFEQAVAVFRDIAARPSCRVHTFDVSGFFDNLQHSLLKRRWAQLLGLPTLPPDHYRVFRAVTRFAFVEESVLRELRSSGLLRSGEDERRHRICEPDEFRLQLRDTGLVKVNDRPFGIAQGSPISALLSNLYMLDFDLRMSRFAAERGGLYRRYADDILLVVPPEFSEQVTPAVEACAAAEQLRLHPEKREQRDFASGQLTRPPIQYLGLTFDGEQVLIRSSSIARYYRRMKAAVTAKAMRATAGSGELWSRALWTHYSHVSRRSFYGYARRISAATGAPAPLRQLRRHVRVLQAEIAAAVAEQGLTQPPRKRPR